MTLETSEERIKLLKSGFDGKQVEKLYLVLNDFEAVGVDWDGTAVKPATVLRRVATLKCAGTQAAPSRQGARA